MKTTQCDGPGLSEWGSRTGKIWTAVAERSGDTAFRAWPYFPKRRGASFPAAVPKR